MQLEAMHLELSTLRSDNREAAAAARKARKRAQQDCEAAIGEFDAEMTERHKEYEQALTAYNELQEQIKVRLRRLLHCVWWWVGCCNCRVCWCLC
jgi:seryl-tRNA synthetase